jgi:hypothetical protein
MAMPPFSQRRPSTLVLAGGLTLVAGFALGLTGSAAADTAGLRTPPQTKHELFGVDGRSSNDVWAVGTQCNGPCRNYFKDKTWVQHFDGTTWTNVPSFTDPRQDEELWDVSEISPNNVWVAGEKVDMGGGTVHDVIQHWDGSTWTSTPSRGNGISGIEAIGNDDVWAVGNLKIHHWDGTSWHNSPFEAPPSSRFSSFDDVFALASNDVWAVGTYQDTNFHYLTLAEHWDGKRWSYVKTAAPAGGDSELAAVSGSGPDDVWVVGGRIYNSQTLAEHWDGTSWHRVHLPSNDGNNSLLLGIATVSPNDAWAVGWTQTETSEDALIEHWDGSSWSIASAPTAPGSAILQDVVGFSSHDLRGVGYYYGAKHPRALHEHYDGSSWSVG